MWRGFRNGTALTTDMVLVIPRRFFKKTKGAALRYFPLTYYQSLFKERAKTRTSLKVGSVRNVAVELAENERSRAPSVFIRVGAVVCNPEVSCMDKPFTARE